jgi:hypothetical protein
VTRPRPLALALSLALAPLAAHADPAPKVCIAVAGDPDEAVRTLARETEARLSASPSWRVVADASTREALRGESPTPADQADRAASRRALRATDADASTLDSVGDALGCSWFVTLTSRSAGIAPRVYDLGRHAFAATPDAGSFDAPAVVLLLEGSVTHHAVASPPTASPSTATPPRNSPVAPARSAPAIARVWPWLVVGGVLLGVVGAVVLLQGESTPRTNLSVVHRGIE